MANVSPLRPYMMFVDKDGTLAKDAYDFLFALFKRVGGSLDSLNAATLETHTWEEPAVIGNVTPQSGWFTALHADTLTTATPISVDHLASTGGVSPDSGGIKHARQIVGTIPASSDVVITHTWTTAFADANYTVSADIQSTNPLSIQIDSITASSVKVSITNNNTFDVTDGVIHLMGMHD